MDITTTLWALYATSTVAALVQTYKEQRRSGLTSPVFNMIGLVLCLVWPLVAALMLLLHAPFQGSSRKTGGIGSRK